MRNFWLTAVALMAAMASASPSYAGDGRPRGVPLPVVAPMAQGQGCYWHYRRLHCNRWCYQEVDGFRYCHRRFREAHSHADLDDIMPPFLAGPMK